MQRWERQVGRWAAAVGTAAGVAYLLWRATRSLAGASPWIGLTTLAVEIVGVLAGALLTWALWVRPAQRTPVQHPLAVHSNDDEPVSVMIASDRRDLPWLRATVLAARDLGPITIVDLAGRDEVARLATELGVGHLATDPDDLNGLAAIAAHCPTSRFLLLDAGDVPHPAIVDRLRAHLADPRVAIVQAVGAASSDDSAEHTQMGRHVRDAERSALNPALGVRGVAMFLGSGAMVRTAALRTIEPGTSSPQMAQAVTTAALFADGWKIVTPGTEPLVALDPLLVANDAEVVHTCEASAARALLRGDLGALRINDLGLRQRLAMLTWAIRPLSGIRRTVAVGLVLYVLLSGRLPMTFSPAALALTWLPWFVLSSVGLFLLSGRRLHPGDRSRGSFRALGTSWRGVLTPNGRPDEPGRVLGGAFGVHHGVAPTAAVTIISIVLGLRGLSDRFTHTLAPIAGRQMAAVLAVSLWSLWSALDALRLLARRTQSRRARRVTASLPCTLLDHGALIVDLTALGAGVLSDVEAEPGTALRLDVVLPTASGCTTARIPAVVRNVRLDFSGGHRLGVQFGDLDDYVADTLAEYCIVQPGLEVLGSTPEIDRSEVRPVMVVDPEPGGPRRLGLRAAALVAVAGALASAAPRAAEASSPVVTVEGRVIGTAAPVEGAVARVVCAAGPGTDTVFGTSDDAYLGPRTAVTGGDGVWRAEAPGEACWVAVALPAGQLARRTVGELSAVSDTSVIEMSDRVAPDVRVTPATGSGTPTGTGSVMVREVVFADLDGDGLRTGIEPGAAAVDVTVYADDGSVVARTVTGDDGTFGFTIADGSVYRIGVSDLPDGWRTVDPTGISGPRAAAPAPGDGTAPVASFALVDAAAAAGGSTTGDAGAAGGAASTPVRLFPTPAPEELAPLDHGGIPSGMAALIIAIAALLAVSVLFGSLVPFRRREQLGTPGDWDDDGWTGGWGAGQSGTSSSPDFAIR